MISIPLIRPSYGIGCGDVFSCALWERNVVLDHHQLKFTIHTCIRFLRFLHVPYWVAILLAGTFPRFYYEGLTEFCYHLLRLVGLAKHVHESYPSSEWCVLCALQSLHQSGQPVSSYPAYPEMYLGPVVSNLIDVPHSLRYWSVEETISTRLASIHTHQTFYSQKVGRNRSFAKLHISVD